MVSTSQIPSKPLHKILASKLTLTIPPSKSSSSSPPTEEFDFSDVFGPNPTPSSSSQAPLPRDPPVIHYRTHSFLGPSPRYIPNSQPFHQIPEEIISQITDDDDEIEVKRDENDGTFIEQLVCIEEEEEEREDGVISKVGPEDFEILRVIGKGAFGKVFQVRKKGGCGGDGSGGDGILAMKVMRKDNIIKKNHVDYMKAERDILTKVDHPFIVQLRYSFQVTPHFPPSLF